MSRLHRRTIIGAGAVVVVAALLVAIVLDLRDAPGTGVTGAVATPAEPAATPAPTPAGSPSRSAPARTAGAASTPDPFTRVLAFYGDLVPAMRDGEAGALVALLHPATIERYGRSACVEALGRLGDPTYDVVVHGVGAPAPWEYATDDLTTTIPDALAVEASVTASGATEARELHVALVDGAVRWFTDCGTPIGGS